MPKYGERSSQALRSAHIDLQVVFNEVIKHRDCTILEGHRSNERQEELFRTGKSKLRAGESKHNATPSRAVDAVPYPIDWNDRERIVLFAGYVLGVADALYNQGKIVHQLRWGGDWDRDGQTKDTTFFDGPHFELL